MSTSTELTELPAIEYPDSDGEPMAENTLQFKWIVTIKEGLEALFLHKPDVFVAGDLLWYAVKGSPHIRRAPDAMVAFGRPKGDRGSYKQWEEGNQPPQAVFEVLSPGNDPVEMAEKFDFYERYGVEEYYVYDPEDGSLEGWIRVGAHLQPIPRMAGFISPRLGIRFEPGPGPDNLTIFAPDGTRFLTFSEWVEKSKADQRKSEVEAQRADAADRLALEQARLAAAERQRADKERLRAEAKSQLAEKERLRAEKKSQLVEKERRRAEKERQRADEERQRAEKKSQLAEKERQRALAAEERAERLAARLRELGIEPD